MCASQLNNVFAITLLFVHLFFLIFLRAILMNLTLILIFLLNLFKLLTQINNFQKERGFTKFSAFSSNGHHFCRFVAVKGETKIKLRFRCKNKTTLLKKYPKTTSHWFSFSIQFSCEFNTSSGVVRKVCQILLRLNRLFKLPFWFHCSF